MTVAEKKWSEMTKAERAVRIKDGQKKAQVRRESEIGNPDIGALVRAEVDKALAEIRRVQAEQAGSTDLAALAKKNPASWTIEEKDLLRREHERLQAALEALPYKGEEPTDLKPGTVVGEGFNRDYVPHTREWFTDVEARRKDRNLHNGKPAELTWPNYQLHDVFYQGTKPWLPVSINGVTFNLLPGIQCKLPTPHYAAYMRWLTTGPVNDALFAEPKNPGKGNGYYHVSEKTGLAVILGRGALDDTTAREAKDAKYE